jgi:hypothetical protein
MVRNIRYFQNRIDLMKGRNRENANIIKKCQRQIRKLQREGK